VTSIGLHAAACIGKDFWSARKVLTHVRDFARARRASPWATLGAVLVRTVVVTPPSIVLPPLVGADASLNLFVGTVAPSGGGKGAAVAVAREAVDVGRYVEEAGIGSGEGLAHLFARRVKPKGQEPYVERIAYEVLLHAAEVDTLAALHGRQASTLFPELRKAWMGEALGFSYADADKRLPVAEHSYRLGLLVGIQPERAAVLLGDADAGTPQRVLWMPAIDPEAPEVPPLEPDPWVLPSSLRESTTADRTVLPVCAAARQEVDLARLGRLRGNGQGLDAHALLARLKVAAALALLEGGAEVSDEDWQLAGVVLRVSNQARSAVVDSLAVASAAQNRARGLAEGHREIAKAEQVELAGIERTAATILRKLGRDKDDWHTRSDLRRFVPARDRGYFDQAIELVIDRGQVEVDFAATGVRYRVKR
jgi:hypothetical protein